ncbi:retrovirus-related Pol polyprotein from transposon 297 [Caerostris extrusa]|uniref:Retrovirus-related Pol polyprotein from transposon 297 n=1 Tax=Caerostris extrusa TaxID=172846 RepID=A0AAV4MZD2_CAEEX|nr:retrovirus-related Pol polyprotein from transposon 297 [Caerostris extrusa]
MNFFHVAVDEESRKFTSFVVPDGQYEFNKVPFGLSTSPSVLQRYVYSIFRHLMNKGIVITYMDDLIIPSEDEVEGHIVENGIIRPSPAKTLAVKRFPVPTNVKRVQSFLGLTSYFRKFIPEYSKIAKPLSDLLRKDHPFTMGEDQIDAFEKLKDLLTRSPVLTIFKQGRTTELHTDASGRELIISPSDMQTELVKLAHEKGHFSAAKTEEVVKQEFFIPNLDNLTRKHIFTVIDAFTKFTWLYPVKTVSTRDALDKLKLQQKTFGNPLRIISDRGSAFTSKLFNDYCTEEGIQHLQIATGVPRGNGQIERIHCTFIPVLAKLSLEDATKWYRYVDKLQRILNSTTNRSTKWTPFELLTGVKMKKQKGYKNHKFIRGRNK